MTHDTEALLMFAARREHRRAGDPPGAGARRLGAVRPLHRRDVRLSGRRPRRADASASRELEQCVHGDCQPDLTILFDVPTRGVARAPRPRAGGGPRRSTSSSARQDASSSACAMPISSARAREPRRFRVIDCVAPAGRGARGARPRVLAALADDGATASDDASRPRCRGRRCLPWQRGAARAMRSRAARRGRMRS